jgi:hypothetical protein
MSGFPDVWREIRQSTAVATVDTPIAHPGMRFIPGALPGRAGNLLFVSLKLRGLGPVEKGRYLFLERVLLLRTR